MEMLGEVVESIVAKFSDPDYDHTALWAFTNLDASTAAYYIDQAASLHDNEVLGARFAEALATFGDGSMESFLMNMAAGLHRSNEHFVHNTMNKMGSTGKAVVE